MVYEQKPSAPHLSGLPQKNSAQQQTHSTITMASALKAAVCRTPLQRPLRLTGAERTVRSAAYIWYITAGASFPNFIKSSCFLRKRNLKSSFSLYSESKLQAKLACPLQNFGLDKTLT